MGNSTLIINRWRNPDRANFEYKIFWPYSEQFDPKSSEANVYVKLLDNQEYVGTFITPQKITKDLARFKQEGHYSDGAYLPMPNCLCVEEISHDSVVRTIDDLLKRELFNDFFDKCD